MKLSLKGFLTLLKSSRIDHGWTYEFAKMPGALRSGDVDTFYNRYVIVGVPPADFVPPDPRQLWSLHFHTDNCVLYCHLPDLARQRPFENQAWQLLGMPLDDMKRINFAACELRGFDPQMRERLLKIVGLREVPLPEREPYSCYSKNRSVLSGSLSSSSVKPRRKVIISVPRSSTTSKKTS